jgi:hypothetical protein
MTLGTFQPRARVQGDKLNLQQYAGRPLLVRTTEFVPDFSSQAYPNPKPVVFADVVDLISGEIFINVLWGAGAVVDNLKDKAGTEEVIPVKAGNVTSPKSGRNYIALFPLEGGELDAAVGWYNQNWAHVDMTRQQRQQQAAAAAPAQAAPNAGVGAQFAQPTQQHQAPAAPYDLHGDGSVMVNQQNGQGYVPPSGQHTQFAQPQGQAPVQQPPVNGGGFGQYAPPAAPATQPPANPAYAPAQQFGQPQAQAPQYAQPQAPQGFGAPAGGVFSDVPPAPPAGAPIQFAPPQGQDPAAAQAALAHLNQTAQQPQQG